MPAQIFPAGSVGIRSVFGEVLQLERSRDGDTAADGSSDGAVFDVLFMSPDGGLALVRSQAQMIGHVNAPHDEHAPVGFHLADGFCREPSFSGGNAARFQRAAQRSGQSAGCRRHQIIERCGVRLMNARTGAVVRGDFGMDAEKHRLGFRRKIGPPERTRDALNPYLRTINHSAVHRLTSFRAPPAIYTPCLLFSANHGT
jgi:hypothetical protein